MLPPTEMRGTRKRFCACSGFSIAKGNRPSVKLSKRAAVTAFVKGEVSSDNEKKAFVADF